ncbi:sodium:proton antiporter [Haloprofundus marisrubri]|uniref:Sodium:proton antiporter n=1 Tax=Haloprofundus marisrubri TaxID=1514971 RepID=A0A0W1R4Z3_9EURY|nr:cation:proton antiporter [Haloprofundus marisrubri]KTG07936.1 sodium:proton antiporter [Haloprofundus marisrubri]
MAAAMELWQVGALFVGIAVAGAIATRVGLSVIPLYVLVGMLVGPNVLGRYAAEFAVPAGDIVTILAEIGIVLLLFFLGLEFSLDRLLEARRRITGSGLLDLGINFPVGVGLGLLFGWSLLESVLLGGIVYISSSAVITKSLIDLGWIANSESEPMLGTLVFEDLFIAIYLAVVAALVGGSGGLESAATDVAIAVAFLGILLAGVWFGGPLFERVFDADSSELFVLRVLAMAVFVAGIALAIGVSEAVAAFFVGMGFSSTDHVERIERLLTPVRDIFAAVFFFYIGLGTDPLLVATTVGILAVAVVATTPTKILSGFYSGRIYDLDDRRSLRVGLGMVTRGEFSLIIATVAATGSGPIMTQVIPAFAVGYVLVMSILGTVLMQYSEVFEGILERRKSETTG